jgi:hypothetical protein
MNRRHFLGALGAAPLLGAAGASRARMRTLDGTGKVWNIWNPPGRFTKNPDMIRFPDGRLMLVFCETDQHWALEFSKITTLESTDDGKTWGNPRVIAEANIAKGEERWVTPRITRLAGGRLVVICDHDDYHYYHEDRPSGIWMWTSDDNGRNWSRPHLTGVKGIEPGRVVELADGTLLMNAHMAFRDNYKMAEFCMRSTDGGQTWKDMAIIAKDKVHNHVEGHILKLSGGALACVLRENNHMGYPSYHCFSYDQGRSWTRPRPLPFAGDRPFAEEVSGGRVLVTYRNQAGNAGTHSWLGDLSANEGYQVSGIHYGDEVTMEREGLRIHNRPNAATRYLLMPPENFRSDVVFEVRVRVDGPPGQPIATLQISRLGLILEILRDQIWCDFRRGSMTNPARPGVPRIDVIHRLDMTQFHTLRIQTDHARMAVSVDGKEVIHGVMIREWPLEETYFGRNPSSQGEVWFQHVHYHVVNESEPEFTWNWRAAPGRYPDQYQIDRILEINPNPPVEGHRPDNGYSSWLQLPGGDILMVDYSNRGDKAPAGHLYAARFSLKDFTA